MAMNLDRMRDCLNQFDFHRLFVEELGWNRHDARLEIPVDGKMFTLSAVAEKCGLAAFICGTENNNRIPDYSIRRKIERQVAKNAYEHLIIFTNGNKTQQIWQWVRREPGRPSACREHTFHIGQPGDSLIQKLQLLVVSLEEEEILTLTDVTGRTRKAFDIERVTKRFYDRFKTEHAAFLKFLKGITDQEMERWYVSVMLNRLMFVYFIQKKGFLNSDADYLKNGLARCRKDLGPDHFYGDFLCPLFFEGFAKRWEERPETARDLLGEVPYLNGGIFMPHQIEIQYSNQIVIPDQAFENLFAFFDAYHWHLDERPLKRDDEINPDVLGYIFEKYINQKQMGAYYTKEDITEYIGKNTVVPFIVDAAREKCKVAFEGSRSVWGLLQEDSDRYVYPAVAHGVVWDARQKPPRRLDHPLELPPEIEEGLDTSQPGLLERRKPWNKPAPPEYALPTEIWREVVARRKRYEDVKGKLMAGEVRSINDLITYNLDIRQFAQDVIENCEGPELLAAFWRAIEKLTVLDPTCGSGAFLFAALNILEPLYEACLERMRFFLEEWGEDGKKNHPNYYKTFNATLKRLEDHPNHRYFILKSIIINNLYGVDIMEEAVEICKLRLFLKLVAQIDDLKDIEPLPDIDFNIRAGNTLVGFVTRKEIRHAAELDSAVNKAKPQQKLMFGETLDALQLIEEEAEITDRAFRKFREMQTEQGMSPQDFTEAKGNLRSRLRSLTSELDRYLAGEYGIDKSNITNKNKYEEAFAKWRKSHLPFHWFAEFYGILKAGGFDVIIGNPPYVEYRKVRSEYQVEPCHYNTVSADNLYVFCIERLTHLLRPEGQFGMIVPTSSVGLDETRCLRQVLIERFSALFVSTYSIRPSKLFDGVDQRLCIILGGGNLSNNQTLCTTHYHHWHTEERDYLFKLLSYVNSLIHPRLNRIAQVGCHEALSILQKIESKCTRELGHLYSSSGHGFQAHYHRSPRYWIRAMDFEQYFKSDKRLRSIHHFRDLIFSDDRDGKSACAIINSSLYFFWFITVCNGRNLTAIDVSAFPVGELSATSSAHLMPIFDNLMEDYKSHSFVRKRTDCEYQEFSPSRSKSIIDEIDGVLARHYSFTDEELDFIINYDIKYRMGQGEAEDES